MARRAFPVKKWRNFLKQVSKTAEEHPEAHVTFLARGRFGSDEDGEIGIDVTASTPPVDAVQAEVGVGWRKSWDDVGDGEWVFRFERAPLIGDEKEGV